MREVIIKENKFLVNFIDELKHVSSAHKIDIATILVVPQIQLSPYAASVLRKYMNKYNGIIIVIYPSDNLMSRNMIEFSERIISLNISLLARNGEPVFKELIKNIEDAGININSAIFHSFAGHANISLFNALDDMKYDKDFDLVFYTDGSRNNPILEWGSVEETCLIEKSIRKRKNIKVYCFGFNSVFKVFKSNNPYLKTIVSSNQSVDESYIFDLDQNITLSENSNILGSGEKYALVLSRYWGHGPYIFASDSDQNYCYSISIKKAIRGAKNIIYRGDNRELVNSRLGESISNSSDCKLIEFNDMFDIASGEAKDYLLESYLFRFPLLLKNCNLIYSFDSSFPLIFKSNFLYNLLDKNTRLVVGFDRKSVKHKGQSLCYDVMKKRTINLVADILREKVFAVFNENGPVIHDYDLCEEELSENFEFTEGFYWFRKL